MVGLSWEVLVAIDTACSREFSVKCRQAIVSTVLYICSVHPDLNAIQQICSCKESEVVYVGYPVWILGNRPLGYISSARSWGLGALKTSVCKNSLMKSFLMFALALPV